MRYKCLLHCTNVEFLTEARDSVICDQFLIYGVRSPMDPGPPL